MKLYLAGPMTGYVKENRSAFRHAAQILRDLGFVVVNPAEMDTPETKPSWEECLQRDIPHLITCDAVVLLPEWTASKGVKRELEAADRHQIPSFELIPDGFWGYAWLPRWRD